MLWGGRNTANKYHWCVWGVLAVSGPPWVFPTHSVCAFPIYTAQAPGCSAGKLSKGRPWITYTSQIYAAQVQEIGYSTKAQTQLGLHFVPFLVLGEGTLPVWQCILLPPQSQPLSFLGVQREHRLKCALCLL